jgi:hypothetical protein
MNAAPEKFPRSLLAIMAGFGLLMLSLVAVLWFRRETEELCPVCARTRAVQAWLVPFTDRAYYTEHQIQDSELTRALEELGYVDPHEHPWLLITGTGPGGRQQLGGGLTIAQGLLTPSVGQFTRLLHRHADEAVVARWLARMGHPQHAYMVRNVADALVQEEYPDAERFRARLAEVAGFERSLQIYRLGNVDEPETRTPPRLLHQRPPR